jgi:hypothetical protein
MNLLAQYGKKLPFNWIVNYADLGRMCSPEETGMNVQQFMRDMSTFEELTAPEHEPEKLKEEVLEYIRQNPEGVTAKTVSDAMKIKVAVSKSILEDLRNAKKIKLDQAKYFPV